MFMHKTENYALITNVNKNKNNHKPESKQNYQVFEGNFLGREAATGPSEFSNQLGLDWLLPISARPHFSSGLGLEPRHAATNITFT